MNVINKMQTGSKAFFSKFEDFNPTDNDWIVFVDKLPNNSECGRVKIKNDDLMLIKEGLSKQQLIELALKNPLKIGGFLTPEFNKYIKCTIDDLKIFKDNIDKLDDKHKYLKIIYNAYIDNNSFNMTDEQLKEAYKEYKKYRKQ